MLSIKKKMFHGFLPILLCMMLLAGAVIPAVPAVTHAEGGDDLLEPPGLAVGLAGTSLDSPDSFLESASEDDVQEDTVTNTVYGEATPERTSMGVGILSEGPTVTVTGNGVENPQTFDLSEFIDEHPDAWVDARVYSTINTWPSKKWYVAEGVKVAALLEEADIKDEAQLIKVKASDGYVMAFTRKELLEDTRYYFPNFKEEGVDGDGHIPGSPEGAEPVDAILALQSVEGSDNPGYMDPLNCPLLVLGQRGVTEQTNHTFVKKVAEIEVSCDFPLKHVKPTADPSGGEVPVGTEVTLTNQRNDDDKIYYTTDGSDPNVWDSLIYNWVASRWWSQRGEEAVAEINHPIVLTEDTTIKAKTIGFGREDSDIVTFEYTVYTVDVIGVSIDEDDQELKEGETVQLTAIVEPEDATDKSVTWSSSNEDVATVDETGLVTAVAEGEAEITVTTNDGDFTDSITVTVKRVLVTGVSILEENQTLPEGATVQLTAIVEPEDATDKSVTWSSSNEDVATVDETGLVTAVAEGTAKITVTTNDGNYTDSITVTVLEEKTSYIVFITPVDGVEVPIGTAEADAIAKLASETTIMDSGNETHTVALEWTITGYDSNTAGIYTATGTFELPEGVEQSDPPKELKVITIVTVQKGGSGSVPATGVSISEDDQMLEVGNTVQLTAVVEPEDATDKSVTWSSDNEAVATVDETGLVTAKGDGEATITVTTTDEGFTDSIKVIVGPFLTITGDGVEKTAYFSLNELSNWKTERPDDWVGPRVYSTINTWPTKKWYAAEGVKLTALLDEATIKGSSRVIKVKATDGYVMTFTREELLNDTRYYFPNFKEDGVDGDGHIPGSPECKEPVDVIIALRKAEGSDNPNYMNPVECPLLVLGQRWVTEQTNHTFVKNVGEIEVSIDPPLKWAAPKAEPAGGEVPAGTEVKLTNEYNDADKIYYTTDGSDPSLESPIYNWVASRWWSQRGMDTVAEINHPIPLSEGTTTIKAKTIGFGREDSEIVTFTYKVIPKKTSESSEIKPDEGGTVSLDDEAVLEIPPGALTGTGAQEVKIERVESLPAPPSGFKLLSDVFEFSIDDKKSYSFAKKVTITLSFDPKAVGKDETPSIHRYDEELGQWINLGGEISDKDNTISVEVDHFSKFAVMVALSSSVTATITPGEGGTVSLGDEATIEIPAGALSGNKGVEVKIERVESPPAAPIGFRLLGDAFEFSIDGKKSYNFAKEVIITLSLDPEAVGKEETPSIHCFDEELAQWENLGGKVSGSTISVEVDHFTKFAVMVELPSSVTALIEPSEGGTVSLGNEVSIEIPPGALTGSEGVEVKIERVKSPPVAPSGFKLLGDAFEITIDGKKSYRFAEEVTIKLGFDPKTATDVEANPRIYYYDEQLRRWVNLGGEISGHTVTVQVDHFTKFALIGKIKLSLTDIAGHWAESNIKKLVSLGAISGYPDGTFRPNNNITRAEFVTVLVKAFQIEGQGGKVFVDTALHWARVSIAVAAASGIAGGYDGDTFRPDDLITREQMAAMIVRAAKLTPLGEELAYTDSESVSGWAVEAVAAAIKSGIMKGYPDNTFRPRGNATRAEAVTAIMNALPEHVKPSD